MAKDVSQAGRPLTITTPLGEDVLLLESLNGVEELSRPFRFSLQMLAEATEKIAFDKILGQPVTVTLQLPDLDPRYFHGIVHSFAQEQRVAGADGFYTFIRYRAVIVPSLWLLTRRIQSRIFQQMTVPDILKKVFEGIKFTPKLDGTFEKRDYCVQYRESDFAFASRLMEEEGIYYFFEHTKNGHQMILANTPAKHPELATATVSYEEIGGGVREEERIGAWIKEQVITSGKVTLGDYDFEMPATNLAPTKPILQSVTAGTVDHKLKVAGNDKLEIYEHPGRFAQRFDGISPGGGEQAGELKKVSDDGTRTVDIRMQEEAASAVEIRGKSNCRLFTSGYKFKLAEHFDANGSYVLTKVEHQATQEGAYTAKHSERSAFKYQNDFRCLPLAIPFRPRRITPKARVEGPQTAVVVGPAGEEIFTDKHGRVKVQFHWDRDGKKDANSSCWVRVGTPWAGKHWGMVHIPRVGQEVIVAFEEGDPDQPLIVGSVYNAEMIPPYTLPDNKTQSGLKSRSTLKGTEEHFNELRFEDKKDEEDIYFHAQKNFHRVVEKDDDLKVGQHQTREIQNNRTTVIKEGDDTFTIEKGSRTETLKDGDESLTLEKGQRKHKIQQDDLLDVVAGSRTVNVKKDHALNVSQGNVSVDVSQGNYTLDVKSGSITIKANVGKISEQAMESIELKVGGNSILINQSGITLKGILIKLEGSGMVQAKGAMVQINGDGLAALKGGVTLIG